MLPRLGRPNGHGGTYSTDESRGLGLGSRSALSLAFAMSALLSLVGGCSLDGFAEKPHGVEIRNDLNEPLQVQYGGEVQPGQLDANRSNIYPLDLSVAAAGPECTSSDIVILTLDGTERARIPPPACIDRVFVVSQWMSQ